LSSGGARVRKQEFIELLERKGAKPAKDLPSSKLQAFDWSSIQIPHRFD
jgi:hypothetical protein